MAIVRYRDAVYETTKRLNPANISNFSDILLYERRKKELLQFSDQDGRFAINSEMSQSRKNNSEDIIKPCNEHKSLYHRL